MKYLLLSILGVLFATSPLQGKTGVIVVNEKNYETIVNSSPYLILDVYADWCGPCKKFGPVMEAVSQEYGNQYTFAKLNVTEETLVNTLRVRSLPTILFYKGGKEVGRATGSLDKEEFIDLIKKQFAKNGS